MPYQTVALAAAFVGSSIAAIWDLKTTEIPDSIPYIMIAVALLTYGVQSYVEGNFSIIANSMIAGLSLLGFGFVLYYLGQWGGGDAKLLSAVGFLLPVVPLGFSEVILPLPSILGFLEQFKFPIVYVFNLFVVGAVYMIAYAVGMTALNKGIQDRFMREVKLNSRKLLLSLFIIFISSLAFHGFWLGLIGIPVSFTIIASDLFLAIGITSLFVLFLFAKAVEEVGFKKRIPISQLKVGDVPMDFKLWEGITEKDLRKMRRSGKKFILIKDGIRFAPAFPIALMFTLIFGNSILLFVSLGISVALY